MNDCDLTGFYGPNGGTEELKSRVESYYVYYAVLVPIYNVIFEHAHSIFMLKLSIGIFKF